MLIYIISHWLHHERMKRAKTIPEILAANIKRRRAELDLTQSQLAERLDISSTYMGELEIASKNASLEVIQRLSEALSMRPYEMFFETGIDDRPSDSREAIRKLTREATAVLNKTVKVTLEELAQKHLK